MIRIACVIAVALTSAGRTVIGEDLYGTVLLPGGAPAAHAKVSAAAMFFRPALRLVMHDKTITVMSGQTHQLTFDLPVMPPPQSK